MGCAFVAGGCRSGAEGSDPAAVTENQDTGWEELPVAPEVRDRQALVATDAGVIAFGGCALEPSDECERAQDGFAFEFSEGEWSEIPSAPLP